jgi:zinc protease
VPWTAERLEQVDLDTALDFYRERFADASDFRFYFVGAIDVEATIPLLERYLATLPARDDGPSRVGDTDIVFPERVIRDTVSAGIEPKSHTTMTWPARTSLEEMEMFTMRMATDILEIRLRDVLREDLGSTYSVEVGYTYMPPYPEYSTTSVRFGSEPGSARRMTAVILDEIARFKADGPTPEEVAKVQELERRAVQTGLEENGYWAASFRSLDVLGWDPERILHRLERIDTLEPEAMRRMFSLYFPEDQYTVITLEPEDGSRP